MDYWQDFEPDEYFHIYNKTVSGIKLFRDDIDSQTFLKRFESYLGGCLDVYAFVLMPNHFHFLVKVKSYENLVIYAKSQVTSKSKKLIENNIDINVFIIDQFKRWLSSYTITYKNKYNHSGSVFMKRFKRIKSNSLEKNIYWLTYIHHNPIHHNYCTEYNQWKYSSFTSYLSEKFTRVKREEVLDSWFSSLFDFLQYHHSFTLEKKSGFETD
jgi:putative transposase